MSAILRVGVVGFGYASKTFHLPLLQACPGVRLQACSSSRPEEVTAALPGVSAYQDPLQLLDDPEVDLVVIPTPNATHFSLASAALERGKHVVVDKPFTLTLAEARQLAALAERRNRVLSVFHNRRWDSDYLSLKALLAEGRLGRVVHFESHFDRFRPLVRDRWRERAELGAGLWYDLGPHLLDQTLQLFGTPDAITLSLASQREGAQADDWFHAVLEFGSMRAILHGSALVPALGPRFSVQGTEAGYLKRGLDPQEDAMKLGQVPGGPGWGEDAEPGTLVRWDGAQQIVDTLPALSGDYPRYYAALRDCILQHGPNPVPADDAVEVMRWLELGLHSAQEARRLPRPA